MSWLPELCRSAGGRAVSYEKCMAENSLASQCTGGWVEYPAAPARYHVQQLYTRSYSINIISLSEAMFTSSHHSAIMKNSAELKSKLLSSDVRVGSGLKARAWVGLGRAWAQEYSGPDPSPQNCEGIFEPSKRSYFEYLSGINTSKRNTVWPGLKPGSRVFKNPEPDPEPCRALPRLGPGSGLGLSPEPTHHYFSPSRFCKFPAHVSPQISRKDSKTQMQVMTTPQDILLKTLAPYKLSSSLIKNYPAACFSRPSRSKILSSSPPQVLFASPHKQSTALFHPGHIVWCRTPRATEMKEATWGKPGEERKEGRAG
ncbi:hypothetical protein B0H19DRAFT_1063252 [Mycena capillaripes]|nr:hypothetical protein B0H19DRAFT_1063252 [Mycena capillaripes]